MSYHNFEFLKKNIVHSYDCFEFLKYIVNELDFSSDTKNSIISSISSINWVDISKVTASCIKEALEELNATATSPNALPKLPKNGFSGVYLCLWEDARSLCISGSLYFDEEDWAANADYDIESCNLNDSIEELSDMMDSLLDDIIDKKYIQYLMYCYVAYVAYRFLATSNLGANFKNTGFGMGYSDGYEILLGSFEKGSFVPNLKDVNTDGYSARL